MRILLADDDTKMHVVIGLWLSRHGHTVESARNGREALVKAQQEKYDMLIADINMPLMNGKELVRTVLLLPYHPPRIMVMTSRCDTAELKREFRAANVQIVNKPFSPQELLDLVEAPSSMETAES